MTDPHLVPVDPNLVLPEAVEPEVLAGALAGNLTTVLEAAQPLRRRYFDTFDWRLHRAGLSLVREDGWWRLLRLVDHGVEAEATAASGPWPRFAADFPTAGDLRRRLDKLLKMRAVVHLVTVGGERRTWRFLNADRKTVLRCDLTSLQPEKPAAEAIVRFVTLRPVRGYDGPSERARTIAGTKGLAPAERPLLDDLLTIVGIEPQSYSSKFTAQLTPDQTALAAAAVVSDKLLAAMRQNEAGLRADLDTEFLHDFRVAVRRQRSALSVFKGVLDAEAVDPFKREFAALGKLTGPLRDLDVYLLDEDRYRALVPAALGPGLDGLFERLRTQRTRALTQVRQTLGSRAYAELTGGWERFLTDPAPGPDAATPVLTLACDRLRRRHHRVCRDGAAIDAATPDPALHRLRIECKKLRYLLEFFASLFAADQVTTLVDHLKGLQDNLGAFNDLCVQQDMLRQTLADLPARRKSSREEAAALGALIAMLDVRRRTVRDDFETAFTAFTRPRVNRQFERLIATSRKSSA